MYMYMQKATFLTVTNDRSDGKHAALSCGIPGWAPGLRPCGTLAPWPAGGCVHPVDSHKWAAGKLPFLDRVRPGCPSALHTRKFAFKWTSIVLITVKYICT